MENPCPPHDWRDPFDYPLWHYARTTESTIDNLYCNKCQAFRYRYPDEKTSLFKRVLSFIPCFHSWKIDSASIAEGTLVYKWICKKCRKEKFVSE